MSVPEGMARVLELETDTQYIPYLTLRLHSEVGNNSRVYIEYAPILQRELTPDETRNELGELTSQRRRVGFITGTYAPLPQAILEKLGKLLHQQKPIRLPAFTGQPGVLFYHPTVGSTPNVLFEVPAAVRFHQFSNESFIGAKDGDIVAPRCVLMRHESYLYAFAVANDGQPVTKDTPLLIPPMLNVNIQGSVCIGSTQFPDASKFTILEKWLEAMTNTFFMSKGSHDHAAGVKATADGRSVPKLLRELFETKATRFPDEVLLPVPKQQSWKTVGDLQKYLSQRL